MCCYFVLIYFLNFLLCAQNLYANAFGFGLPVEVTGILGDNGTEIECSYTKENVLKIDSVIFMAFNRSSVNFEPVATFIPDTVSLFTPQGQYLVGRVTLKGITQSSPTAVMVFDQLLCLDDTFFKCHVRYIDSGGVGREATSDNITISVQVPPSKPEKILLKPLPSTQVLSEGDNVTFSCSGNVGKPPQKFDFQKYLREQIRPLNFTGTDTSTQEFPENCSFYRTSRITFQVAAKDNKAVIRCIVSFQAEKEAFIESEPLHVNYKVRMATINKHPDKADYFIGLDTSITLTCTSDGNPKPSYLWYKDKQTDAIGTNQILTINDVNTTGSGVYTCFVSNTINDVIHTKRVQVLVNIINEANEAESTTHRNTISNTTAIVVGLVCGTLLLVICVILLVIIRNKDKILRCSLPKTTNNKSIDYVDTTQQQNPSFYEEVGNCNAADLHNYEQLSSTDHHYSTIKD
ncbi:CD166 antigen-like [Mytilus edulis]|uniref:CD166 antigen-like n=1 Tax=Mytilus edulis TaxID=6550 RepID=UPI0039F0449C